MNDKTANIEVENKALPFIEKMILFFENKTEKYKSSYFVLLNSSYYIITKQGSVVGRTGLIDFLMHDDVLDNYLAQFCIYIFNCSLKLNVIIMKI